jgi:hypothetical protein
MLGSVPLASIVPSAGSVNHETAKLAKPFIRPGPRIFGGTLSGIRHAFGAPLHALSL